jgi:hypothetical protein
LDNRDFGEKDDEGEEIEMRKGDGKEITMDPRVLKGLGRLRVTNICRLS